MEARAEAIAAGRAPERVWLLEHPPLYTAGTSARPEDLIDARFPVFRAGRGGQFTYHGPGQRVAYVMLDLKRRRPDVRAYVAALEGWLIDALEAFGVAGETREDRVGVWVARPDKPRGPRRSGGRGQDRRDRRPGAALGDVPWRRAQRRAGPRAFLRHRALRDRGAALRRDQPRRSRPRGDASPRSTRRCAPRSRRRSARPSRSARRPDRSRPRGVPMVGAMPVIALAGAAGVLEPPLCAAPARDRARPCRSRRCTTRSSASGGAIGRTASSIRRFFRKSAGLGAEHERPARSFISRAPRPTRPALRPSSTRPGTPSQNPEWREPTRIPSCIFSKSGLRARAAPASRHRHGLRARRGPRQGPLARRGGDARLRPQAARRRHETAAEPRGAEGAAGPLLRGRGACGSRREAPDRGRKLLVFVQCGKGFDAGYLARAARLRRPAELLSRRPTPIPRADAVVFQAGTKTTAIRRLLDERPDLLLRYEAVLFLDDDVEIGAPRHRRPVRRSGARKPRPRAAGADRRFRLGLALPQEDRGGRRDHPGVDRRDHGAAPDPPGARARRLGLFARPSAAGEPISSSVRRRARPSGRTAVGVVGSVAVRHARPVDTAGGAFYAYLRRYGIDPAHEANRVVADFGVERFLRPLAPGEAGPVCRLPSMA